MEFKAYLQEKKKDDDEDDFDDDRLKLMKQYKPTQKPVQSGNVSDLAFARQYADWQAYEVKRKERWDRLRSYEDKIDSSIKGRRWGKVTAAFGATAARNSLVYE